MKVRTGFVSNSSSTSYTVLLPDDAEFKVSGYEDETTENAKRIFNELRASPRDLWLEEIARGDYEVQEALVEGLQPYIISSIDTGPDAGQIVVADKKKVREILGDK